MIAAALGALAGTLTIVLPSGAARDGPAAGASGPIAIPLTINWFGGADAAALGRAGPVTINGIGTVRVECDYGAQELVLVPASSAGTRTVADVTTFQGAGTAGSSSNVRYESYGASTPIKIPLPVNGMLGGTFSVEPDYGAGGPGPNPASFVFSSESKLNGETGDEDDCAVAGQIVVQAR